MRFLRWILSAVFSLMALTFGVLAFYLVFAFFFPFLGPPVRIMNRLVLVMLFCVSPLIVAAILDRIGALLETLRRLRMKNGDRSPIG